MSIKSRPLNFIHDIPIIKTKKFWDGLNEGKIYATKCKDCGKVYFPPQVDCPKCLKSNFEWIPLTNEGEIETFTESHLKPQGFTHYEKPYIIAIAKTLEGVKIMGWLEGVEISNVKVGMKVEITSKTQPDGYPVILFKPKTT
ncbi:MAG: Zn-ribbon domain-containing OB-fold protein [Candidatus Methanomethylicia archaeon]